MEHVAHDHTYIGSHDIAAIVNHHPFLSRVGVFMSMMGLKEFEPTEQSKWGLKMEPTILQEYRSRHGNPFMNQQVHARHEKFEYIGSTIDGILIPKKEIGVDAKNVRFKKFDWGPDGSDEVPTYIYIGMQWHMMIHHLGKTDVAALFSGSTYHEYEIDPNEDVQGMLLDAAHRFMKDHILKKEPPEMDASDDAHEYLKKVHPDNILPVRAASSEEISLMRRLQRATWDAEDAEKTKKMIENQIKKAIGDTSGIGWKDHEITYKKTKDSSKTDFAAVLSELPGEIWEQYNINGLIDKYTTITPGSRKLYKKFGEDFQDGK